MIKTAIRLLIVLLISVVALSAVAQGTTTNTLQFNEVGFSFDTSLAAGATGTTTTGTPPGVDAPGGPFPPATILTLTGYTASSPNSSDPQVTVFATADFAAYGEDSYPAQQAAELQQILTTQPDLSTYANSDPSMPLPYLPGPGASQILRAQVQYLQTEDLVGIRYLTAYAQDVSPLTEGVIRYTFQGLTRDGSYYVSVIFPIMTGVLPQQIDENLDYDAFAADYEQYLADLTAQLNGLSGDAFTPSLSTLDAFVNTITIAGADSSMGSGTDTSTDTDTDTDSGSEEVIDNSNNFLAGTSWVLVSYGDPSNPTPVLENTTITLNFEEAGGVSGNGGCNNYFSNYEFSGDSITFGLTGSTAMACEEAISQQEIAYLGLLQMAGTFQINEDTLQITTGDGQVLNYTRA